MRRLHVIASLIALALASGGRAQGAPPPAPRSLAELPILSDRPLRSAEPQGLAPMVDTARQRLSAWPVDGGDASYALARSHLDRRSLPPADALRITDFIAAFDYGEEPARDAQAPWRAGGGLRLTTEVFPSPFRRGYHVLHVGLNGGLAEGDRKGATVVVVLDVSGKTDHGTVRDGLELLLDALDGRDRIGILGRVVLEPVSVRHRFELGQAVRSLRPGRSKDLGESLARAYEMAARSFEAQRTHHVLLCTDGGFSRPADELLALVRRQARRGIALSVVGFGPAGEDALLARMAGQGDGRYAFVDHPAAVRRLFAEVTPGDLEIVARDVRSQVELDPRAVSRYRLLGRAPQPGAFADDRNGGELAAGEQAGAFYEIRLTASKSSRLGVVRVLYETPEGFPGRFEQPLARSIVKSSPAARLAWIAASFGEKLTGSYWTRNVPYWRLLASLDSLAPRLRTDPRTAELRYLMTRAAQIDRRRAGPGPGDPTPAAGFESLRILE